MAKGIAVKVDESLLREIHVKAAQKGLSTQQYITGLIAKDLFPEQSAGLSPEQAERIRQAALGMETDLSQIRETLEEPPQQSHGHAMMDIGR